MNLRNCLIIGAVLLAGCGEVISEQRVPAQLDSGYYKGEPYDIVTQTVQGDSGTFERSFVVYRGRQAVCRVDSPRDCELTAQRLVNERFFGGTF